MKDIRGLNYITIVLLSAVSIFLFSSCSSDNNSSEPNTPELALWENFINQNNILSSTYDKDNNTIWLGTESGLLKLDATDLEDLKIEKIFSVEDGLLENKIYSLLLNETSNEIWIGTHSGISVYNLSEKTFTLIVMEERLYSNHINVMEVDTSSNMIYVGTDDGINIYDITNSNWSVKRFGTGFPENYINDVFIQKNYSTLSDDIWFGTNGGAFKKDNNLDEWFSFTENDGLIDNEVLSFAYDFILGRIYIGTRNGASVLSISNNNFIFEDEITTANGLSNNTINDIKLLDIPVHNRGTYIYFATNNGFNIYSAGETTSYFEEELLSSNGVNSILSLELDLYMNTVILSTDYGISSFKIHLIGQQILFSDKYFYGPYNNTDEVLELTSIGSEGNILFFTSAKGLISYDTIDKKWNYYYTEDEVPDGIESIYIGANNIIWIGTDNGVYKYDQMSFTLINSDNSGLPGDRVYSIFEDRDNYLWFGTNRGLAKFNESLDEWTIYDEDNSGIPYKKVYAITYDDDTNYYWIGTRNGFARFDGNEEWIVYNEHNGMTNDHVKILQFDNLGNIWINHENDDDGFSLTKFNPIDESFEIISATPEGLLNDNVFSMFHDSAYNELYLGTYTGLCSYNTISGEWKHYENSFDYKINGMTNVRNNNSDEYEMWLSTDKGVSVMREF